MECKICGKTGFSKGVGSFLEKEGGKYK